MWVVEVKESNANTNHEYSVRYVAILCCSSNIFTADWLELECQRANVSDKIFTLALRWKSVAHDGIKGMNISLFKSFT